MIAPLLWSMFFISIFSMIMVTLRVAWHELVEDIDVDDINGGVNEEEEDIAENEGDAVEKLDTVDERGDDVVENPIQDNESSEQEDGHEANSAGTGNKAQSDDGDDNLDIQKDEEKEENDDTFKEESG